MMKKELFIEKQDACCRKFAPRGVGGCEEERRAD
jgi:hypothetical protein